MRVSKCHSYIRSISYNIITEDHDISSLVVGDSVYVTDLSRSMIDGQVFGGIINKVISQSNKCVIYECMNENIYLEEDNGTIHILVTGKDISNGMEHHVTKFMINRINSSIKHLF